MKLSQKRKIPHDITYVWNLQYSTNEPNYKTERESRTKKPDWWLPRGWEGGREWELGVGRRKLSRIEWINSKVPLYSTGNYILYLGQSIMEKNIKANVCMCVTESFAVQQKLIHCKSTIIQF